LILQSNSLALYVDDTGDEQFTNAAHPIFAFGGVACIARDWRAMKARFACTTR